ncbi:MAG: alpha/beta fold hydrolase [Verrucomicrobia bacterium]|nr:alpha/beta fold hydrolase [Verrucomicrobiota bacterium]
MHTLPALRILLLGLTLVVSSCSHYSTVSEKRPDYKSSSAAGQMIAGALKHPAKEPQAKIGQYLDAAAAAGAVLAKNPGDTQARADYNFAVARIFETINDAGLEPWNAPVPCPGASQTWSLSFKKIAALGKLSLSDFNIRPADRYQFQGRLVVQQSDKAGLGAPLVINTRDIDVTKIDPFAQGKHAYYGVTGLVDIKGRNCTATLVDPLSTETVKMDGRTYPLAANFTAPIALALAELDPRKKELGGLFKPDEVATKGRLARLQPYDPKKIPILCIHGLGDSQATWAPMIESLRADPVIRANYQIWFFSYPSGNPYPASAAVLRQQMDAINKRYPDHKRIVVIGHSMGGMISRTLMTDSGMSLWNAVYDKPPAEMPFTPETRKLMTGALIFKHRPEISRVIFCSPSHRGADMATNFFGRMGSKMIGNRDKLLGGDTSAIALAKPTSTGAQMQKMPNSIDFLDPKNRFVNNLAALPLAKGIPYHSILGDRGKGGNLNHTPPVSSDGIVPYWSSHLDGAQSELIIPSGHWTNQHPQGIAEVKRILYQHLGKN